jgi:hypothetical protein
VVGVLDGVEDTFAGAVLEDLDGDVEEVLEGEIVVLDGEILVVLDGEREEVFDGKDDGDRDVGLPFLTGKDEGVFVGEEVVRSVDREVEGALVGGRLPGTPVGPREGKVEVAGLLDGDLVEGAAEDNGAFDKGLDDKEGRVVGRGAVFTGAVVESATGAMVGSSVGSSSGTPGLIFELATGLADFLGLVVGLDGREENGVGVGSEEGGITLGEEVGERVVFVGTFFVGFADGFKVGKTVLGAAVGFLLGEVVDFNLLALLGPPSVNDGKAVGVESLLVGFTDGVFETGMFVGFEGFCVLTKGLDGFGREVTVKLGSAVTGAKVGNSVGGVRQDSSRIGVRLEYFTEESFIKESEKALRNANFFCANLLTKKAVSGR